MMLLNRSRSTTKLLFKRTTLTTPSFTTTRRFYSATATTREQFNLLEIQSVRRGTLGTLDFALYFTNTTTNKTISPWHDIPYTCAEESTNNKSQQTIYHYIHEISLGERRKMEVNTKEPHNPITQDVSKGKPREFTYGDLPFNYGCIPQTWEDPNSGTTELNDLLGDNDPVDVVELSQNPLELGKIYKIKVLGILALIDQGEVDWKVIAIRTDDKLAHELQTIGQLTEKYPKLLENVFHWFRYYKTTDGKAENVFALDGKVMDQSYAIKVIEETHEKWRELVRSKSGKLWTPDL